MSLLGTMRRTVLGAASTLGISRIVRESSWRKARLLILGFHGISTRDEHVWDPELYMTPQQFRSRLALLREHRAEVLALDDALHLLDSGRLPARAVAITFDDGAMDFSTQAYPLLREFGFPATLFLTTFYCFYQRPVFPPMARYLFWKSRSRTIDVSPFLPGVGPLPVGTPEERTASFQLLRYRTVQSRFAASQLDALLGHIATQADVAYDELLASRFLHLMSPEIVAKLDPALVDLQMHTHRHRVPLDRELFLREVDDNRRHILEIRPDARLSHFCYPSGVVQPEFLPWLRERGVTSAVTCNPGLTSRATSRLQLPRLMDGTRLPVNNFRGWVDGVADMLPQRRPSRAAASRP